MARIVVVGSGVVGAATGHSFVQRGHDVRFVDIDPERVSSLRAQGFVATRELVLSSEETIVLVALPTPAAGREGYDLSALVEGLEAVGAALGASAGRHVVVVRSTVPPFTTDRTVAPTLGRTSGKQPGVDFGVAYAPEFLREATASEDARTPWMTVIASRDASVRATLGGLFAPLGGELRSFDDPVVAEVIKITHNAFNAAKISFWNEMWRLCQALDIDADAVADVVSRSAEASTNPDYGIRGGFSFGGSCLPKDLEGLLGFARSLGIDLPLVAAIQTENQLMAEHSDVDRVLRETQDVAATE